MCQLALLADQPQYAEQVARWYFDHWVARKNPGGYAEVLAKVQASAHQQCIPFIVLALSETVLVGAAEVKFHGASSDFGDQPWLDGVYVEEAYRGQGVASRLVAEAIVKTKQASFKRLYLQTKALDGGLYARAGFKPIEQLVYNDQETLVMMAEIAGR